MVSVSFPASSQPYLLQLTATLSFLPFVSWLAEMSPSRAPRGQSSLLCAPVVFSLWDSV